jgi:hypothetical protein
MEIWGCFAWLILAGLLVAWLPVTRWLVGPLLARSEKSDKATTYYAVDFMPLVFQLSLVGMLLSRIIHSDRESSALAVILLIVLFEAIGSWWLSVRCLTLGGVSDVRRRFLFQLVVVPCGVFFPILLVLIPATFCYLASANAPHEAFPWLALSLGLVANVCLLVGVYVVSRWVTAGAECIESKGK